jgi:hypothetical protein
MHAPEHLLHDRTSHDRTCHDRISAVDVDVDGEGPMADLAHLIDAAVEGTAFRLDRVEVVGSARSRCRLVPRRAGMAIGYRNVIDLQARLDRVVRLVGVSCHTAGTPIVAARVA